MAKKSYDWVAIKVQFVNSSLSTREFAEKYGIPFGTLTKQVAQGKWLDERIIIGSDTEQKSIEFSVNNRAVRLAKFDDDCIDLADDFRKKAKEFLHQIDSPMALKALTGAMKDTQAMARLALGASTENQATSSVEYFGDWAKEIHNAKGRD
ncbi:hypothetical protein A1D22_05860 [Pasteurellaceae bacterium LFhippo2]|nr:hypothetical protein [Pasteurellaceae bacterium LFhippo2]